MSLSFPVERRLLQIAIMIGGCVPVAVGIMGALNGAAMNGESVADISLDSHVRYLSGLLLAIGLAFWASVRTIERRGARMRLLTAIVFLGGLMRLLGVALTHRYAGPTLFGLGMELVVTPLLCLWQARIARFKP